MIGTVAVTERGWYEFLCARPELDEVNFWRPSARRRFIAPEFSPFLFKLRSPNSAICGFAYFARYSPLPIWLAWETFGPANGCPTLDDMHQQLNRIRHRIRFKGGELASYIGCTLLVETFFFPPGAWVVQPRDWKDRTQTTKKYDLSKGEGKRVWEECLAVAREIYGEITIRQGIAAPTARYGDPIPVRPRLGQNTFRIAVTDAYERACTATGEHSLPALDAGHIRPFAKGGEHKVSNGLLLRADLHRLLDKGYVTVDHDHRLIVGRRLKEEFQNGQSYYPFHGTKLRPPPNCRDWPDRDALRWHNDEVFTV